MSSLGFRPSSIKSATFLAEGSFAVKRVSDEQTVFSASLDRPTEDAASGQTVYVGDFSEVRAAGIYYLEHSSSERSASFPVDSDVYLEAYRTMMLGFHGQRCGTSVSLQHEGTTFEHAPCHEASIDLSYFDGAGQPAAVLGGWHDAGDYGRYTVNGGFTAGLMLRAWEDFSVQLEPIALPIPERDGLPHFLAEVRWQLDWLLAMEYADGSGRFSNALKSPEFPGFVMPESDTSPLALASVSSAGTAIAAAALAQAARVYRPHSPSFADQCEQAASRAYAWLQSNPSVVTPNEEWAAAYTYVGTPADTSTQVLDAAARLWAAAELWATTGSSAALTDFESRAAATSYAFSSAPDWPDPSHLGVITYLRTSNAARAASVVEALSASVVGAAAELQRTHDAVDNGWGRAQGYWWGANGTTARSCLVFKMAERLDRGAAWSDLCAEQIGYLMGRNPYGRSQVTGIGIDPPLHLHHRLSSADAILAPWPGLLVGGPQQNGAEWLEWTDSEADYATNETAINWNAALVYAFASMLGDDPSAVPTDGPDGGSDAGGASSEDAQAPLIDPPPDTTQPQAPAAVGGCGCEMGARRSHGVEMLISLGLCLIARRRPRRASNRQSRKSDRLRAARGAEDPVSTD